MNLKTLGILALAGAAALAAKPAMADSVLNLSLQVTPNAGNTAGTWSAFADVEDPATAGLAGIQFDVIGAGGVTLGTVAASNNKLPTGSFTDSGGNIVVGGFHLFRESSLLTPTDAQFRGGHDNTLNNDDSSSPGNDNLAHGFGLPGTTGGFIGDNSKTWGFPALIATGSYTGSVGTLSIATAASLVSFFPSPLPTANGASIQTHSPNTVNGQTFVVGTAAAPLPSSVWGGMFLIGSLALRRKLQKA
jgi:hypothetical protein